MTGARRRWTAAEIARGGARCRERQTEPYHRQSLPELTAADLGRHPSDRRRPANLRRERGRRPLLERCFGRFDGAAAFGLVFGCCVAAAVLPWSLWGDGWAWLGPGAVAATGAWWIFTDE